ncbi:PIN domain nuclease [Actinoplanes regularis]|uniref:Ribonuclease VapC n=1 Tax=Actinoplanes regularis TaxID=52697 RepID=A0A239HNJ6_9ACTN|nr:PIN domain nuclease [Actinoplanes regularis]GIE91120.1 hypothetical protein Are01nite_76000 [Actinoplanes regularis]SNS82929.1 hypothetical protein SAMN06264365_12572 [Actinoplanes regularis]
MTEYLADTSALVRFLRSAEARGEWSSKIEDGYVATCAITELELLYTARSKADLDRQRALIRESFSWVVMPDRAYERAAQVQTALAGSGTHRSAGPVDLLTAAAAELNGLTLLHYDNDFVQVAKVTGQPVRWIADPGSLN